MQFRWHRQGHMTRSQIKVVLSVLVATIGGIVEAPACALRRGPGVTPSGLCPGKDYAATRYSAMSEINAESTKALHPVWTFSTGVLGGHEGQPPVVGNTMYVVTPWPNALYAFDLTRARGIL